MATISGGNAPIPTTTQPLGASTTQTLGSVTATPEALADTLNSTSTRALFISELRQSGLLGPDGTVGHVAVDSAGPVTAIDQTRTPVVIENTGATTLVSNGPILVALGQDASATLGTTRGSGVAPQRDTIIGGSGSNAITGNAARSLLIAGTGRETIQSGHGRDTIWGGTGQNTLIGGGRSEIAAGSGRTLVEAGGNAKAHDTVYAGAGRDTISLTSGDNAVALWRGKATVQAGSGNDTVMGGAGAATVASGAHTTLTLGKGSMTLNTPTGAAVNDTIYGGANSGDLRLNVASTAATVTQVDDTHAVITFGGNTLQVVDAVNIVFSDQTRRSV